MSTFYRVGLAGDLCGPVPLFEVPGVGLQAPGDAINLGTVLVEPDAGFVWAWVNGAPAQLADHRGTVYSTATGEAQAFHALGELPEGLTAQPWPGRFHVWSGTAWALDEAARLEAAQGVERTWRNAQIGATDYLAMPDYPLAPDQRSKLYIYRQELRDWPDVTLFPDPSGRPKPPEWIAQLPQ